MIRLPTIQVFALLLLCACAAVNILFYTLPRDTVYQYDTERFVDLQEDDEDDGALYRERETVRDQLHGNSRLQESLNDVELKTSFRKLHNTNQERTDHSDMLFSFSVNNYEMCIKKASNAGQQWDTGGQWDLVIVVFSKVNNFLRRHAIRNTWASELNILNTAILFLIGQSLNGSLIGQVAKEAELYNDVIQVEIFDNYQNLTLKSIAMLQWLQDYCPNSDFYLKSDDDMYINVENVNLELHKSMESRFFLCHVFKKAPPDRNEFSKWYTSKDEFSGAVFPTYCSGTAYGFSSSIVSNLYKSALHTKHFRMEDVFLTGMAALNIQVKHVHSYAFTYRKRKPTGCAFQNVSTGHEVTTQQMYLIFAQLQNKEINCNTKTNMYLLKAERDNY